MNDKRFIKQSDIFGNKVYLTLNATMEEAVMKIGKTINLQSFSSEDFGRFNERYGSEITPEQYIDNHDGTTTVVYIPATDEKRYDLEKVRDYDMAIDIVRNNLKRMRFLLERFDLTRCKGNVGAEIYRKNFNMIAGIDELIETTFDIQRKLRSVREFEDGGFGFIEEETKETINQEKDNEEKNK